jgi:large subunit ribosomal protein LP0
MPKPTTKAEKKSAFLEKLTGYLNDYGKILLVDADNVTSLQMAQVRQNLRGKAAFLMGKNTMIRRALKGVKATNPAVVAILGKIVGNLGMIFTNEPLDDIVEIVESNKKQAPARSGAMAPCDVVVPKGSTGMDPTQTAFFQALNIATKITKGAIEIINDTQLLTLGQKVGSSEAVLLAKLGIKPFQYGLKIKWIYDNGSIYGADVLKIKTEDLLEYFMQGVGQVTALSLGAGYLSKPALPHFIGDGFKNLLAVTMETDYTFPLADKFKAGAAAAAAAGPAKAAAGGAPAAAAAKAPEPEPEDEDDDMGMSLFD